MASDFETAALTPEDVKFNDQGLVPCIVQDAETKDVLMMAWMNAESLRLSMEQATTWFYSRSRGKLWHKGEESGNTQELVALYYDCDADTLLALVHPAGPACHTGSYSCFYRTFGNGEWDGLPEEVEGGKPSILRSQGMKRKLGIKLLEESATRVRMRMPIVPSITQPAGFVHGGATVTLLETAASWASWYGSDMDNEMSFGSHVDIHHVSSGRIGFLYGLAELDHVDDLGVKGRKEYWHVEATDDAGNLVSTGTITCRVVTKAYYSSRS
mgnify:CR=1 FL=1